MDSNLADVAADGGDFAAGVAAAAVAGGGDDDDGDGKGLWRPTPDSSWHWLGGRTGRSLRHRATHCPHLGAIRRSSGAPWREVDGYCWR